MQTKSFTNNKAMSTSASELMDERMVLRIDREALKSATPKVRFSGPN